MTSVSFGSSTARVRMGDPALPEADIAAPCGAVAVDRGVGAVAGRLEDVGARERELVGFRPPRASPNRIATLEVLLLAGLRYGPQDSAGIRPVIIINKDWPTRCCPVRTRRIDRSPLVMAVMSAARLN